MLEPGVFLGPYEILGPLGAGGMGVVYRARDPRLSREVAIKVLPADAARDPDRLRRLDLEARATGSLNHPNVLAVFDIGQQGDLPYVVSELLEGETLRDRMRPGALAIRKSVEYAIGIARGLAAAHERGIVHRDLTPDNVFITRDGRVKILDFGLARYEASAPSGDEATSPHLTPKDSDGESGAIMGTVGYVSPEQVRGLPADHRSDIFALGLILYEMLTGERAFRADTTVETLHAILKDEPPLLLERNRQVPPALDRLVRRCLEKDPEERFQSARDVAFHLEDISHPSGVVTTPPPLSQHPRRKRRLRFGASVLGLAAVACAAIAAALALGERRGREQTPIFHRLSFRRGTIHMARFAPDGQTIVYSAAWGGDPVGLFSTRTDSPEARALEPHFAHPLGVSSTGELALLLLRRRGEVSQGTLARAPLGGGAPREVVETVEWADWSPDGREFAVVRIIGAQRRLEFPIGRVLYEPSGWISHPRVSPRGDVVAYLDHPVFGDNRGSVEVVDRSGTRRPLSGPWKAVWGLAWNPGGREIWFTASETGSARTVYAVDLSGRLRVVARVPLRLSLNDISLDGKRVVVSHDTLRRATYGGVVGEGSARELSWHDYSNAKDLSADGQTLLFSEDGEAGGSTYAVYVRPTNGATAIRLGEGKALALSPDAKWALAVRVDLSPPRLVLLPTGPGEMRTLPASLERYDWALFLPDGEHVLIAGKEPGHRSRLYLQDLSGGHPHAVSPEGISASQGGLAVSPDGREAVAVSTADQKVYVYPLGGGEPELFRGLEYGELPVQWSADGAAIFVLQPVDSPPRVRRVERKTGRRTPWIEITPPDPAGILGVTRVRMTRDGKRYVYSFSQILSDLYLVEGMK